jgi:hypothetical protein
VAQALVPQLSVRSEKGSGLALNSVEAEEASYWECTRHDAPISVAHGALILLHRGREATTRSGTNREEVLLQVRHMEYVMEGALNTAPIHEQHDTHVTYS